MSKVTGERPARTIVKIAVALLPRPERDVMTEAWMADLDFAHEANLTPANVALGAVIFVSKRGPAIWYRRRPVRFLVKSLPALVAVCLVSAWIVIPSLALGVILWLIASPTDAPKGIGQHSRESRFSE